MRRSDPIHRAQIAAATLLALCGVCLLAAVGPLSVALLTGRTKPAPGHLLYAAACTLVFVVPACIYLALLMTLRRRSRLICILGILAASLHILSASAGLISLACFARQIGPFAAIPGSGALVFLAACIVLILSLRSSMRTLHAIPDDGQRGFEPMTKR